MFLNKLASRKTPTTLVDLRGISLNLIVRERKGGTPMGNSSDEVKSIMKKNNIGISDCHRMIGKDNRQMLVYLKYTFETGDDRRKSREGVPQKKGWDVHDKLNASATDALLTNGLKPNDIPINSTTLDFFKKYF